MKLKKMNKNGAGPIAFVLGGFIAILLLIFLTSGGISTTFKVTRFLKSIPAPVWVVFGIVILFKLIGRKK